MKIRRRCVFILINQNSQNPIRLVFLFSFQISDPNEKFHVELHFSPGSYTDLSDLPKGTGYRPKTSEVMFGFKIVRVIGASQFRARRLAF